MSKLTAEKTREIHARHPGLSFHQWRKTTVIKQEKEAEERAAHVLTPEIYRKSWP